MLTCHPYRPPRWLPGGHLQTIWPKAIAGPLPFYQRERWDTPDGDFIDLDWIDPPAARTPHASDTPCIVLFHGLEGSSQSHYARRLMMAAKMQGWRGVVVHFRGCSGEPNRLPRAYHSGDSAEIDWILRRLAATLYTSTERTHRPPLFAVGVSLGGNALLKWMGEQGETANRIITAAAAISAPVDLAEANRHLSSGFSLIYARHFLRTLIPAALVKEQAFPGCVDPVMVRRSRTLADFDDAVTAPLHGFSGADDYYARSSAGPWLKHITTPCLLLHAANDPFLPAASCPVLHTASSVVTVEVTPGGGHVGFVEGRLPGSLDWLPRRLLAHFSRYAEATSRHAHASSRIHPLPILSPLLDPSQS